MLDGGVRLVPRPANSDAKFSRGSNVDDGVSRAGTHEESKVGQALQDLGRESCPFPHGHEHIEPGEATDRIVGVGERLGEDAHFSGKRPPIS